MSTAIQGGVRVAVRRVHNLAVVAVDGGGIDPEADVAAWRDAVAALADGGHLDGAVAVLPESAPASVVHPEVTPPPPVGAAAARAAAKAAAPPPPDPHALRGVRAPNSPAGWDPWDPDASLGG